MLTATDQQKSTDKTAHQHVPKDALIKRKAMKAQRIYKDVSQYKIFSNISAN